MCKRHFARGEPEKFAAAGSQVDKSRQETLLAQFDKIASELLYLGVPRDTLIQRIQAQGGAET